MLELKSVKVIHLLMTTRQVHTAVQQYIQYTILRSHVAPNSVLFAESVDTTSAAH